MDHRHRRRAVYHRVFRRQDSLRRQRLGRHPYISYAFRPVRSWLMRRRTSSIRAIYYSGDAARRRVGVFIARHKSCASRRCESVARTGFQLGVVDRRGRDSVRRLDFSPSLHPLSSRSCSSFSPSSFSGSSRKLFGPSVVCSPRPEPFCGARVSNPRHARPVNSASSHSNENGTNLSNRGGHPSRAAAYFFWTGYSDGVFASAVLAAAAFFLSIRFQMKERNDIRKAEADSRADEDAE